MTTSFFVALFAALFMAGIGYLIKLKNQKEIDPSGMPQIKYKWIPYILAFWALFFLGVAVYQGLDPFNHRYPGNIVLLSVIPGLVGLGALLFAVHTYRYAVTLRIYEITVIGLFGQKSYSRSDIVKKETSETKTTLHFANGKRLNLYKDASGYEHFIAALER